MMIPVGILPLLHEIFPSGDAVFQLLLTFVAIGAFAGVVWRRIAIAYGARVLVAAVILGAVLFYVAVGIAFDPALVGRGLFVVTLGAFAGSAWLSHRSIRHHPEGGAAAWWRGTGGYIAGTIAGMAVVQLLRL